MRQRLAVKNREEGARGERAYLALRAREIEARIRRRYSLGEELALLRQREQKPGEFLAYYQYAEACKRQVTQRLSSQKESKQEK